MVLSIYRFIHGFILAAYIPYFWLITSSLTAASKAMCYTNMHLGWSEHIKATMCPHYEVTWAAHDHALRKLESLKEH